MRKAAAKRVKITKSGKLLYRHSRQNHFNAKESRRVHRRHKKMETFSGTLGKKIRAYLYVKNLIYV